MLYKDDIKRYVLYVFKKGFEDGLAEEDIIKVLPNIPGDETDKQNLFTDCKAYLFLDTVFINHPEIAINLANKYIENHQRDINLVDEKLYSMYSKTCNNDLARPLLEQLLAKEPDNKWTISKKINELRRAHKFSEAIEYIESKHDIVKNDPVIFNMYYKLLCRSASTTPDDIVNLFRRIPMLDYKKNPDIYAIFKKNLQSYLKHSYILDSEVQNKPALARVRNMIKEKLKNVNKNGSFVIYPDISIVKLINSNLDNRNVDENKMNELLASIKNETIKFCMQCQVAQFHGKNSQDLVTKVKSYSRNNSSKLDDTSKKSMRFLCNLLTGNLRHMYLHHEWVRFQEQYFEKIVYPIKQKNDKANTQNEGTQK